MSEKQTLEEKWWCIANQHDCECNYTWTKEDWNKIKSALKLQKLVKERMRVVENMTDTWKDDATGKELHAHVLSPIYNELQSLLEESEK